jgi:YHS domain-containing protein
MPKMRWRVGWMLVATLCLAGLAQAQAPTTSGGSGQALLNLDNTVALHGYDPVPYFEDQEAVKGKKWMLERVGGATYYFASGANRYTFLRDAPRYQPQFGGYCAGSMAMGKLEDIDPEVFSVYQGKLYLFNNETMRDFFMRNPTRSISEATQNFFKLSTEKRSSY